MTANATLAAAPLRGNRDFRLLWVGGLLGNLGSQMAALALPLLVLAGTGSPAWAGVVGSVSAVATLLSLIPGGAIADATERRRLMVACELAGALAAGALALVALAGRATVPVVLPATVVIEVLGSVYGPAAGALLRAAVPGEHLGSAMSYLQARSAAARLAGPLVGGALFAVSPALPFAVQLAGLLVSCGCLLAVRARAVPAGGGRANPFSPRKVFAGLAFLWRHPYLRTALLVSGVGLNSVFGAVILASVAAATRHDPSGRSSGLVVSVAGAGTLAGALLAPRLHAQRRPRAAMLLACWTCAAAVCLLAFVSNGVAVALLVGGCLLTASVASIAFATTMLVATPGDLVGRVQAAAGFISMIVQPAGPVAGGVLLERVGQRGTFAVLAAVLLGGALAATVAPGLRVPPVPD